ncbi:MAG: hypothetical protein JSS58_10705 [Proteobacteria bacterium]|nr:hypothetical protein [Pseudomonadota bacterium]
MRTWLQETKQTLRFLAAARCFLPQYLETTAELENVLQLHLRRAEMLQALDVLEQIGDQHSGYEEEANFWKELFYAAQHMALPDHATRYEERIRQVALMQRMR